MTDVTRLVRQLRAVHEETSNTPYGSLIAEAADFIEAHSLKASPSGAAAGGADGLIAAWQAIEPTMQPELLAAAIPKAIDAVYAARDSGRTMHSAGADAAVAALKVASELGYTPPGVQAQAHRNGEA